MAPDIRKAFGVQVGLDEPEELVALTRDLGKEVGRVGVAGRIGLVDGESDLLAQSGQGARQGLDPPTVTPGRRPATPRPPGPG